MRVGFKPTPTFRNSYFKFIAFFAAILPILIFVTFVLFVVKSSYGIAGASPTFQIYSVRESA